MNKPIFTIDWEPWFCLYPYSSFWEENGPLVEEPTYYLLDLLRRHQIKATWFVLGWLRDKRLDLCNLIEKEGHTLGCHTYYHVLSKDYKKDLSHPLFRSPRFEGQKKLYSGGFWLRAMPYWWLKREVLKEGQFFIHPHDLLFEHPKLPNLWQNWYRHTGLKTSRDKLERLCREVEFASSVLQPT